MTNDTTDADPHPSPVSNIWAKFWESGRRPGDGRYDLLLWAPTNSDAAYSIPDEISSDTSYIEIMMWMGDQQPDTDSADEIVGIPVQDGERYAMGGGEVGTVREFVREVIDSHLDGSCSCLDGGDQR